jgi:hypothetical protein
MNLRKNFMFHLIHDNTLPVENTGFDEKAVIASG